MIRTAHRLLPKLLCSGHPHFSPTLVAMRNERPGTAYDKAGHKA